MTTYRYIIVIEQIHWLNDDIDCNDQILWRPRQLLSLIMNKNLHL